MMASSDGQTPEDADSIKNQANEEIMKKFSMSLRNDRIESAKKSEEAAPKKKENIIESFKAGWNEVMGPSFDDDTGLVAMSVKYRCVYMHMCTPSVCMCVCVFVCVRVCTVRAFLFLSTACNM